MDFGTFALEFVETDLETAFEGETGIELDLEFELMMTEADEQEGKNINLHLIVTLLSFAFKTTKKFKV